VFRYIEETFSYLGIFIEVIPCLGICIRMYMRCLKIGYIILKNIKKSLHNNKKQGKN